MQTSTSSWTILQIGTYGNIVCPVGKYDMKSTACGYFLSKCMQTEHTRKYYASSAPFLWITRSGIDEKADTLLTYLQKASLAGLRKSNFIYPSFKRTCDESVNWISTPKTTSIPFSDVPSSCLRKLISDTYADNASDTSNRTIFSTG